MTDFSRRRRIEGCLLGTAVGDALGLPCEGLSRKLVLRRFAPLTRFQLIGRTGFVSDDTEQSALVAQALCRVGNDEAPAGAVAVDTSGDAFVDAVVGRFRRSLLGWFLRLPFGIGLATIRACLKMLVGVEHSGVDSAGNGAAMRSAIVGAVFAGDAERPTRVKIAEALARVTHTDARAVAAAVFVADVAARDIDAIARVTEPQLRAKLDRASELAEDATLAGGVDDAKAVDAAVKELGTSGFVLESVPFAWFCFLRFGPTLAAVQRTIEGGGDADTNAAIVGGWVGAWDPDEIPAFLVDRLAGGPFGPRHLRALATSLDGDAVAPGWFSAVALMRNLALYPVVLAHGLRRLLPF